MNTPTSGRDVDQGEAFRAEALGWTTVSSRRNRSAGNVEIVGCHWRNEHGLE